jgi:hypothetical protein
MKKALTRKYLSDHYRQDSFVKFHNFWKNELSVENYTAEFDHSMMHCDIVESEEQMVSRYHGELHSKISNVVELQPYCTYNDVCKLAHKVKKQLKERHRSTYQPFNQGGITNWGSSSTTKATPYSKVTAIKSAKDEAKPQPRVKLQQVQITPILLIQIENALNVMVLGILLLIVQIAR